MVRKVHIGAGTSSLMPTGARSFKPGSDKDTRDHEEAEQPRNWLILSPQDDEGWGRSDVPGSAGRPHPAGRQAASAPEGFSDARQQSHRYAPRDHRCRRCRGGERKSSEEAGG